MAWNDQKETAKDGRPAGPQVVVMNSLPTVKRNTKYLDEQDRFDHEGLFDMETLEYSQLLVK